MVNTILTDDEINARADFGHGQSWRDFARAIEAAVLAKLREQEPVAWRAWNDEDGYTIWADEQDAINNSAHDFDPVPLVPYAAPLPAVVQVPPNNDVDLLLRQVFALCEATEDAPEVEPKNEHQRGFDKGRRFEAKQIRRAIGDWFQAEFCGRYFMGEPVVAAPEAAAPAVVQVPQEWKLVPVEPSDADIRRAANMAWGDSGGVETVTLSEKAFGRAVRRVIASLAAAPEAPAQASAVEPVRDERAAFEAWVAKVQPAYWRAEAWQTEAWAMWQSISAALGSKERQPSVPAPWREAMKVARQQPAKLAALVYQACPTDEAFSGCQGLSES